LPADRLYYIVEGFGQVFQKCLAVLSLFFTLSLSFPIWAAGGPVFEQLYVDVWPEYNQNNVLVSYNGVLVNNTDRPFQDELCYYIPSGAQISMVCETERGMVSQKYEVRPGDGYDIIAWRPSRAINPGESFPVMMEYYYHPIEGSGQRQITYHFRLPYAIENLSLAVREPLRATGFSLIPQAQTSWQDAEGFRQYGYQFNDWPAEEPLELQLTYSKPDNQPSIVSAPPAAPENGEERSGGTPLGDSAAIVLITVLAVLAVVLIVFIFRANGDSAPSAGKKHPGSKGGAGKSKAKVLAESGSERKKLRRMLLDGKISEETYQELLEELKNEGRY